MQTRHSQPNKPLIRNHLTNIPHLLTYPSPLKHYPFHQKGTLMLQRNRHTNAFPSSYDRTPLNLIPLYALRTLVPSTGGIGAGIQKSLNHCLNFACNPFIPNLLPVKNQFFACAPIHSFTRGSSTLNGNAPSPKTSS